MKNKKIYMLLEKVFNDKKEFIDDKLNQIEEEIKILKKENKEERELLIKDINKLKKLVEGVE